MNQFRENMGEVAFRELNKLVKEKTDIRMIHDDDLLINKRSVNMLLTWITRIYELTERQLEILDEPDIDLEKLYKIKE